MRKPRTTICCRRRLCHAVAALQALFLAPVACAAAPARSHALFPLGIVWTANLGGPPAARPAYDDASAYVPLRNGQLVAFSIADGQRRWWIDLPTTLSPAAGDHLVFVASGDAIHAVSAADGSAEWQVPVGRNISAPPLWDSGWLIAGREDGEVLAFRARDGQELWRRQLVSAMRVTPSIAGDALYVPLQDGRVVKLDLNTGGVRWERKLGGEASAILALDDRIFVGSADNRFYCLSPKDGRVRSLRCAASRRIPPAAA